MTGAAALFLGSSANHGYVSLLNTDCNGVNSAGIALNPNGTVTGAESMSRWINPTFGVNKLEARLVQIGGATVSGSALNSWLNLSSQRGWQIFAGTGEVQSASCTLSIREAVTGIVLSSCTVTMTASNLE